MAHEYADDEQVIDRRTLLRRGALVAGVLSTGVGTVSATGRPFEATIDPTGMDRYLPCTDETVVITDGTIRVRIHSFVDGDGGVHLSYHSHWHPRGVGVGQETGIRWTGQGTKSITSYLQPPFPQTVTRVDNSVFTSEGSDPNFIYRLRTHTTVNAAGEITAFRSDPSLECTGGGAE